MPTVGDMKFDYTDEGIAQAEQHSMQTGIPVDYESEDTEGDYEPGSVYAKIKKTSVAAPYKMKGNPMKRHFGLPLDK